MIRSDTLSHAFVSHPERMDDLVDQYVQLARSLHSTHMPKGTLPDVLDLMRTNARNLNRWCTDEQIDELLAIIDALPACDTILHGDLHPNNIMIQDTELVLIDLAEVAVGPRALDLAAIYRDMIAGPKSYPAIAEANIGMPTDMIEEVVRRFFATYTAISDPDALKGYLDQIGLIYAFNTVLLFGSGIASADQYAAPTIERLLEPVVLPNKEAIPHLIATL